MKIKWQKHNKYTYVFQTEKYKIVLRPERTICSKSYGKTYSMFVYEIWAGEKNVWQTIEIIPTGTLRQSKKEAIKWLKNKKELNK